MTKSERLLLRKISLGSNLTLFDKIVRIALERPLEKIKELKTEEDKVYALFEPKEKLEESIQYEALWAQNSSMLRD